MPGILISNVSFPKYLEDEIGVKGKPSKLILPYLINSIKQLERAGADFIVLPCNTLQDLLPILRKISKLEIIDLIEEASKQIENNLGKIGILSTKGTRNQRLYDKNLKNTKLIYPSEKDQEKVSKIIVKIIRNQTTPQDKEFLENLIKKLTFQGCEKIILACTDLGNLIKNNPDVLDTTEILIKSIIKKMKDILIN